MALTPEEMSEAIIRNLKDKTGKPLEEWIEILKKTSLTEKKEVLQFLKEENELGHFQALTIYQHYKQLK